MNRNVESHFAENPTNIDISRSTFDRSASVKTTFNVGDLVPFYVEEVLPGDTFKVETSRVVRMQTLLTPMMDNVYLDTYYFFVPNRLVWSHWKQFNGESEQAWIPAVEYTVPQISAPSTGWNIGTIADYMGIPTGVANIEVNALPFRAYALICNEWFRDQNVMDPVVVPVTDATVVGTNGTSYITDVAKGGYPFKVSKYHDYFTSALPAPQKGPDVLMPAAAGTAYPVYSTSDIVPEPSSKFGVATYKSGDTWNASLGSSTKYLEAFNNSPYAMHDNAVTSDNQHAVLLRNLWAIPNGESAATINALRLAFQLQKAYEKDARGGTRYVEMIKAHFGVTSPDARQQRPEYLGGNRIPINVNQVVQNSESGTTAQGTVTGYSVTTDKNSDFVKSFTEHGFIIGVMAARYDHTYQQGIERFWSRKTRFQYYLPVMANIGEMEIKNKEIYAQGSTVVDSATGKSYDDEVFGYQEAWADYRYKPNRVTGEMRSAASASLDVWHLADDYSSLPSLSDSWMFEDKTNVDRVLAVTSSVSNQLFADIYVKNIATRPMPLYSIPGLIDHH